MRCFPDCAMHLVLATRFTKKVLMNIDTELQRIASTAFFSNPACGGICFAFRQYVSETHDGLGDKWKQVVDIYYAGHWPIGVAAGKLVLI